VLKRLKQAWKRDRLGVLGVSSAVATFVLWAWPVLRDCEPTVYDIAESMGIKASHPGSCIQLFNGDFGWATDSYFSIDRLPAIGAFLALTIILLLLRRR